MIRMMKARNPPILATRASAQPKVVACAIAMSRGERFESEARALQIFGVAPDTKVRKLWVNGHLKDFAPAGLGVPGEPSLPFYLLERGEPDAVQARRAHATLQPHAGAFTWARALAQKSHGAHTARRGFRRATAAAATRTRTTTSSRRCSTSSIWTRRSGCRALLRISPTAKGPVRVSRVMSASMKCKMYHYSVLLCCAACHQVVDWRLG